MKTKTCPECDKFYSGYKCGCGYVEPRLAQKAAHDPDHLKCAWIESGMRCKQIGTVGSNTAWYCSWHYEKLKNPDFDKDKDAVNMFFDFMNSYKK